MKEADDSRRTISRQEFLRDHPIMFIRELQKYDINFGCPDLEKYIFKYMPGDKVNDGVVWAIFYPNFQLFELFIGSNYSRRAVFNFDGREIVHINWCRDSVAAENDGWYDLRINTKEEFIIKSRHRFWAAEGDIGIGDDYYPSGDWWHLDFYDFSGNLLHRIEYKHNISVQAIMKDSKIIKKIAHKKRILESTQKIQEQIINVQNRLKNTFMFRKR